MADNLKAQGFNVSYSEFLCQSPLLNILLGLRAHFRLARLFLKILRVREAISNKKGMFSYYNPSYPVQTFPSLQANGIFELQVTNNAGETVTWTIDLKKTGTVFKGKAVPKADVTIILSDDTLVDLASGKVPYSPSTLFLYLTQVIVIPS